MTKKTSSFLQRVIGKMIRSLIKQACQPQSSAGSPNPKHFSQHPKENEAKSPKLG